MVKLSMIERQDTQALTAMEIGTNPQSERLQIGQNIFDQPAFQPVNELGEQLHDIDGVRAFASHVGRTIMHRLVGQENNSVAYINVLDVLLQPDAMSKFKSVVSKLPSTFNNMTMHFEKGSPHRQVEAVRDIFGTLMTNLEEPFWKLYYLYTHKGYYNGNGEYKKGMKILPKHVPLKYDAWVQNFVVDHDYSSLIGLDEALSELGYTNSLNRIKH